MKELLQKLLSIEQSTSEEKGEYHLFAFFLRDYFPGRWDILVAASWINSDRVAALKYLSAKIKSSFNSEDFALFNAIILIDDADPELLLFQEMVDDVKHGTVQLRKFDFNGVEIKRAFVVTSVKREIA